MADLIDLARRVEEEVTRYVAPPSPDPKFGSSPEPRWVIEQVGFMRHALVAPYRAEAIDDSGERRSIVVVADDLAGNVVVYDPNENGDFALTLGTVPDLVFAGPRGDVVGCFLAR